MTLPLPLKVLGLGALAVLLAAAGVATLVLGHSKKATPPAVTPVTVHPAVVHPAKPVAPPKPKVTLVAGLPQPLHAALLRSREVVVFLYVPSSPDDRALLAQVRQGAHDARVGFVALDLHDQAVAEQTFTWAGATADPATYVVRRPGKTVFAIQGLTDRTAVAQAAAAAK